MAGRKLGKCGGCGSLVDDCEGCTQCLPRYLCVGVVIDEPGPYVELTECCESFGFRVPLLCEFSDEDQTWHRTYGGGGACPEGVGLSIEVQLVQVYGECQTIVSCTELEYSETFDGWPPNTDTPITFNGTDFSGNQLTVTISCANVIENPLALELCSPCSCLRCLPCKLCVQVAIPGRFFYDPDDNCEVTEEYIPPTYIAISAAWNGNGWTIPEQEITLDEQPDDPVLLNGSIEFWDLSDGCGIHIEFSMGGTTCFGASSYEMDLRLDNGIDSRRWGGTDCRSNEGIDESVGTPQLHPCPDDFPDCPEPQPQRYISFIDEDFTLENDDPYKLPLGVYVRIRDQSCGECVMCQEPIPESCCPDLPDTLQVSASGSGGTSTGTLTRGSGASWTGAIPNFRADCTLLMELTCDADRTYRWRLDLTLGCDTGVGEANPVGSPPVDTIDCDAFEIVGTMLTTGLCCDMNIESITVTVTT